MTTPHFHVAIAGSGFAGLGMAIRMKQSGQSDFVIFERAQEVGGVWRDNTYPGCACDVESHLYSFSFAPNPGWSRAFSPQEEILAYLRGCADRFGVRDHVRLGHTVERADWDEAQQRWWLSTSQGPFTADVLIAGVGALSDPSIPPLQGLERFGGKVMHSARWDHGYKLAQKKVAVIGTGASAIQFIPAIQPEVAQLKVFQRTAPWILPRRDKAVSRAAQRLFRSVPLAQKLVRSTIYALRELLVLGFRRPKLMGLGERLARRYLERTVTDPVLRAKLTPSYTLGCKRILLSDDYLPSLTRPNVEVITEPIREVTAEGLVTEDGAVHPVDAILFGTGFHVTDLPIARQVHGRGGRTLQEVWEGSPRAHLGTTVSGFPNLFLLQGPNTGLGHTSVITMLEAQFEHVLGALKFLQKSGAAAVEPKPEAQAAFVADVDRQMQGTVWTAGGCKSWYLDETGRNSTLWPGFTFTFRRRLSRFDPREYAVEAAHG